MAWVSMKSSAVCISFSNECTVVSLFWPRMPRISDFVSNVAIPLLCCVAVRFAARKLDRTRAQGVASPSFTSITASNKSDPKIKC